MRVIARLAAGSSPHLQFPSVGRASDRPPVRPVRSEVPMFHAESFVIGTSGRGTHEITEQVQKVVRKAGLDRGLCNVFVHHTSASLIICENADASVRQDLERFFARLAPDGDPIFRHTTEGPDDMPAHLRSILTQSSISIPVRD